MLSADLSLLDTVYTESSNRIRDNSINLMRAFGGQEKKRKPHGARRKQDHHHTMLGWLKFRGTGAVIEEEESSIVSCETASDDSYTIYSKELLAQAKNRLRELNPIGIEDDDLLSISNSLYTCDLSLGERFRISEMSTFEVSDDDLSICSEDLLAKAKNRLRRSNLNNFEDNDLLSTTSSLNTCRQSEISGLKKKIHTSEMTRHELVNRCVELQKKVENADCNDAMVEEYCQQNVELREDTLNVERNFRDEVSKLVHQMADLNKKYTETVSDHDNKITEMQLEICRLKEENAKLNSKRSKPTK